jgi:hypothetical protein
MKPIHTIVLVDDNAGPDVTPAVLTQIAAAVQRQVREHWAPLWGHPGVSVTTGPAPSALDASVPVYIRASSDVQGAAGYHDDDGIYVFRDGLPSLLTGAFSLSVVCSHEILEALGDPGANRWADTGRGYMVALEMCDVVEGYCYEIDGVSVSDFVTPSFFDPDGQAPYSKMNRPGAPMTVAPDSGADYQIELKVNDSGEQQVTADLFQHPRRAAKMHPSSRTSRRGVAV